MPKKIVRITETDSSIHDALERIRLILSSARASVLQVVNLQMIRAYWEIGREIVEEEQRGATRAEYGLYLLKTISVQLSKEFGRGFDESNLRHTRNFYLSYPIWDAVRPELSWTHYRMLLKVSRSEARAFYEQESILARWSTRELDRQIHSLLFERYAKSRDKAGLLRLTNSDASASEPTDLLRDPFVLEFTGLPERGTWQESDLETALLQKLQSFLLELGRDFFFVAQQKRITVESEHHYVDLVFYHRTLRCFVLIGLKVGKLTSADVGQMLAYTGFYETFEMREGENPPIGLILCTNTTSTTAKYALRKHEQQVFAARYQTYLPTEQELQAELERERLEWIQAHSLSEEKS
jgi:predicted nuclease of restriction endonuclease-like (RecB) superfamily